MLLRNSLLMFSFTMIAFSLSLYFQSEEPIHSTLTLDQYKYQETTGERSNSLEEFNLKASPFKLQDAINDILNKNKLAGEKTRVMQIGILNGRILMELKTLFPEVEFYGVAKEKTHDLHRRENFYQNAIKYNIMSQKELESTSLPFLIFQDVDFEKKLPYDNGKFDLIFSINAIPKIRYTFEFLNEVLRLLKDDGISVHTDFTGVNIYHQGMIIDLQEAMVIFRKIGIDAFTLDQPGAIRFRKSNNLNRFPVSPHTPVPETTDGLSPEQRRPEMSYNLVI